METNKPVYPAETYGFEIPDEVLRAWAAGTRRNLIREDQVENLKFVDISHRPYRIVKRVLDIVISFFLLILAAIPIGVISLIILLNDHDRVMFSQYRIGLKGKRFKIYKFRTMYRSTPKYLATKDVKDPSRYITPIGRVLRKTSLDELPQLWNVLRGDMSLIGPRPLIADEIEIHRMRMRFGVYNVRPGITGLAQINGRDTVSAVKKVRMDVKYIQRFGLKTDLKVLAATFPKVLAAAGIVEGGKRAKKTGAK